ncbi:MAG: DNA primase [Clostridia bacterium]|nr:DNA primase [Clostridia bacterium]
MARYSEDILEDIRQSNDIVDVISQYVRLKRSGRNFFGLCPFHNEKSPSFSVSPDKQIFHCFGCGVGGNIFTFISKIEGISFKESVEVLAERANIQLPKIENSKESYKEELKAKVYKVNKFTADFYHKNLYQPTSKIAQEYIKKRKLNNETLKSFQIGFSGKFDELYKALKKEGFGEQEILESGLVNKNDNGKFIDRYRNRLMFPICDTRGRVIAFGGRVLDNSKPKYINSPENIVYSKGRHLFGLNVAKKGDTKTLLIVEGYMDVISLHQRGITNVVAALGTALTQQQGWLLRKNTEKVILGFDSDGAGQTAIIRSLEILQNMGCDMRVLQMEGAKDPDEYILKYGVVRFQNLMQNAISLFEFKVKNLKQGLNLENSNDKIKFLNEIAKLLAKIDNTMEKEVYIEKISKTYDISKEAIYAQVNKLSYVNSKGGQILEKSKPIPHLKRKEESTIPENIKKRENTILSILINKPESYKLISSKIKPEDFKYDLNRIIANSLYEELEKGNSNISNVLDSFEEETRNHVTMIMAYDLEIDNLEKAINDILNSYKREKLDNRKLEIIEELEQELDADTKKSLEKELSSIINELAKIK